MRTTDIPPIYCDKKMNCFKNILNCTKINMYVYCALYQLFDPVLTNFSDNWDVKILVRTENLYFYYIKESILELRKM